MASAQVNTESIKSQEMEPLGIEMKFADAELNGYKRYKTCYWDTFQFTTFENTNRPGHNDREWRLFKFDGYNYQQVWQGFIPSATFNSHYLNLRGIIQSPNGKSFTIIGSEGHVFVLKGNKCGPLLEGARFTGLGVIFYSPSTNKYYGILSKRAYKERDNPRVLTFAEISLNFNGSGELPDDPTNIRNVINRLFSFEEINGNIKTTTFTKMFAPDMFLSQFSERRSVLVSYINPDSKWKHWLKIGMEIKSPLHIDTHRLQIRKLPNAGNGQLISINPNNPCEMLYLNKNENELCVLSASCSGIELEESIPLPFYNNIESYNHCIIIDNNTNQKYYWDYEKRTITKIKTNTDSPVTVCSIPGVVYLTEKQSVVLRPADTLEKLATSGYNLSTPVASVISKFLHAKYKNAV